MTKNFILAYTQAYDDYKNKVIEDMENNFLNDAKKFVREKLDEINKNDTGNTRISKENFKKFLFSQV